MFVYTGDYIEHTNSDSLRSTYYTFTPLPLTKGSFYTMNDDLAALLATAHRTLGILEGATLFHSDIDLLADLMLFKESCFSKKIDQSDFNIQAALLEQGGSRINHNEIEKIVSSYRQAMKSETERTDYNNILGGMNIRTKPVFLKEATANYRQYNPTAYEHIAPALADLGKYVEQDGSDILIRTAMCHYQFEIIHPYEYNNGIVGRILICKILNAAGIRSVRYLNLSTCLYRRKSEYFEKLGLAQKNGSYDIWLSFFIRAVTEAAHYSIEFVKAFEELIRGDEEKITLQREMSDYTVRVYRYFKKNVVSSIGQTSQKLSLSFNTVSKAVEVLQQLGILKQITNGSRNRLFAYTTLMNLILFE